MTELASYMGMLLTKVNTMIPILTTDSYTGTGEINNLIFLTLLAGLSRLIDMYVILAYKIFLASLQLRDMHLSG